MIKSHQDKGNKHIQDILALFMETLNQCIGAD